MVQPCECVAARLELVGHRRRWDGRRAVVNPAAHPVARKRALLRSEGELAVGVDLQPQCPVSGACGVGFVPLDDEVVVADDDAALWEDASDSRELRNLVRPNLRHRGGERAHERLQWQHYALDVRGISVVVFIRNEQLSANVSIASRGTGVL